MVNVFIFHGVGGSSSENWFPWMKAELQAAGHTVIVPDFPHPNRPQLDEWLKSFEQYKHLLSEDSVLVGHSLGGAFALRLLQSWNVRVLATFLVASVWGVMDNEFDPLMRTFTETSYDWQRINQYAGEIHILHSDNDPYIKLAKAEELAKNLGITVELITGGAHFNKSAGYLSFPVLKEKILAAIH